MAREGRKQTHAALKSDSGQQFLDFGGGPDGLSVRHTTMQLGDARTSSSFMHVGSSDLYQGLRDVVSDGRQFQRSEDSPFPFARLETIRAHGVVQLKPEPAPDQPLLPMQDDRMAESLWDRVKGLSDLQADVFDIMTAEYARQARTIHDRATIDVDQLLARRGIRPKKGGRDAAVAIRSSNGGLI